MKHLRASSVRSSAIGVAQINETNIASFVKLRNGKTHSGTVERGDNTKLYAHY